MTIKLWDGSQLRGKLMRADAEDVRRSYFDGAKPLEVVEGVATLDDPAQLDDALFVRQLHEAGHVETDASRGYFFAADALFRDVAARGDQTAIDAVRDLHLEVHAIWEQHFNASVGSAGARRQDK